MKRWTARWTMAAMAAALLTLPVTTAAQGTQTQPPTSTQQTTGATTQQQPNAEAQEHLRKARATLDEVKTASVNARVRTQVNELKKRLTALERAAGTNDQASATGQANRNPKATANRGNTNWGTEVAAIDKALTALLGTATTTGATTPPATGTTGTSGTAKAGVTLDEETRTKLTEFRTHITAFATAMAGGTSGADTTSASGTSTTGTSGTATSGTTTGSTASGTTASGTTGTTGSTSGTATSGTTPQTQTADPQQQATPQVDQEAARRHLTDARNALSAMTQLPAAAQLQGDARTQISQLIANFNELITTQSEWRATYAKLEANLTALIGPDAQGASQTTPGAATGSTGTTGTTGTAGTPATAGTSGAAAGIADLDPGIRERLTELRRHLNLFEQAAGGGATAGASGAMTSGAATSGATGTTASGTTGTTTSGTTTSGTTASGTTASGTTGTTGTTGTATSGSTTAGQQTSGTAQGNPADLAKHLAAIDALLQTTDESGGLTLTKAQVEQLRTHWAAVRQILNERR